MFHFNKKHLEDPATPMWVLKAAGKTYYVDHVTCQVPWSTKETPSNTHTKGSIKVKNCLVEIDAENAAMIRALDAADQIRLRNQRMGITRVIVRSTDSVTLRTRLRDMEIKHGPIKSVVGGCSSTFYITDIMKGSHFTALGLAMLGTTFRELMPNEGYYRLYDRGKDSAQEYIDSEDYWDEEELDES